MNDRCVSLLDNYEVEVLRTAKARGAILCETNQGLLIFKEYTERRNKIFFQNEALELLHEQNFPAERILRNKEGELLTPDYDGTAYVLKTYFQGKECDLKEARNSIQAVRMLAELHKTALWKEKNDYVEIPEVTLPEFGRRTRELKKIRRFLKTRSQKADFEILLMQNYAYFFEQALKVEEEMQEYASLTMIPGICHGDFQYHNILINQEEAFLVHFEKCAIGDVTRDLGLFLRKILEKTSWQENPAFELLEEYEKIRPLSEGEKIYLYGRLAYPEKFWKIANFYYNSGKAWIPMKNTEKLYRLLDLEEEKKSFLEHYRGVYL